jgi:hypothetical protein
VKPAENRLSRLAWLMLLAVWLPLPGLPATSATTGATNLWSLQPLQHPTLPAASGPREWRTNPIDAFVADKLRQHGLQPAPPADRSTLLRRLSFDLIGLPPSAEEMAAFLRDSRSDAYSRAVDRLLASSHHGERWARHWLDVVRFGESQGFEYDRIREHAWRYRDYVIQAFNDDKPYDRFIREQLAGDVLPEANAESVIATGFLIAGPWDQAGHSSASASVRAMVREAELEDIVGTVGQTFLGVTLNCARCHNHKFDPIPQRDYYRIKAVFQGVNHGDRRFPGGSTNDWSYAANASQPEATFVLNRGEPDKPREQVTPGALEALATHPGEFGLAADAPEGERRRRFAAWVASPENPLTARVIVNRVWQHHFGRGIVATPNDFGKMGEAPSNPELLDWLAAWFVAPDGANWSLKRLHKLIVSSAAYQQSAVVSGSVISEPVISKTAKRQRTGELVTGSLTTESLAQGRDADNLLLWRFTPHRLEAEELRDALLALSGELNPQMGGPGFRPFRHVTNGGQNEYFASDPAGPEFNRRTIYRISVHSARDPLLDSLDCPEFSTRTPVRANTTTPLQALSLMNDSFVQRQAAKLAERVQREAGPDLKRQVKQLWFLALAREPKPTELREAVKLAREQGMASAAWVLLNSNEFVFVR